MNVVSMKRYLFISSTVLIMSLLQMCMVFLTMATAAEEIAAVAGCPLFPADNIWNTPVDNLPLDVHSDDYIASIGATTALHPDFGAPYWDGARWAPIGIPYNVVNKNETKKKMYFDYYEESDPGPYPIPDDPAIEGVLPGGDDTIDGDRHILVVDSDACILYETWYSWPRVDGGWDAGSGAIFDLTSHALRPRGWTSADAAGLPILPGLIRLDEVEAGEIKHAIRFTAGNTHIRKAYTWPARHHANTSTSELLPPMGQRFRLKSHFDITGFSRQMRVILQAMKTYGIILADNGSDWYISGVPDDNWDNDMLVAEFANITGGDFEAVDVSSLMEDPNSGKVRGKSQPPKTNSGILTWLHLFLREKE